MKPRDLAKRLGPSKASVEASLWGTGASAALAAAGAGVVYVSGQSDERALAEGATGGFVLGALVGTGIAVFSPKNRTFGLGMVGLGGIAALVGLAMSAAGQASAAPTGRNHQVSMVEGQTVIVRVAAGDTVTVLAPMGWSIPIASPAGTLAILASDAASSSATFRAAANGSAEVTSTDPNSAATAVVAVDVS